MLTYQAKQAYVDLGEAMRRDGSYAWVWHCNIAVAFQNEGGSHEMSNRAAARFMQTAFGVDVTVFEEWKSFKWVKDSVPPQTTAVEGVVYSPSADNFYLRSTRGDMGSDFYKQWRERRTEFPQVGAIW